MAGDFVVRAANLMMRRVDYSYHQGRRSPDYAEGRSG